MLLVAFLLLCIARALRPELTLSVTGHEPAPQQEEKRHGSTAAGTKDLAGRLR